MQSIEAFEMKVCYSTRREIFPQIMLVPLIVLRRQETFFSQPFLRNNSRTVVSVTLGQRFAKILIIPNED